MEGLAIASKGLEETAACDIKEIINSKCRVEECSVLFDFKKIEDLCLLCYKCQSVDKVLLLLGMFEFKDFFDEIENFIDGLELKGWLEVHKKFRVDCMRQGNHNFKSTDVETSVWKLIVKKFSHENVQFDIKNFDIIFLAHIVGNKCYFGINFAGMELNKRSYKIFLHSNSLRGTIAYSLVRESGFRKNDVLLDPFTKDGIIPIEAALYASGFPVNYYNKEKFAFLKLKIKIDFEKFFGKIDKKAKKSGLNVYGYDHLFKYVDYSRKNAKIAGVDKLMSLSRVELEWLDIKFKKGEVDVVVTSLPNSKNADLDKIYNEFFYQCDFILKKDGKIVIVSRAADMAVKHAKKHNFEVMREKAIWSGEQQLAALIFKKKTI